MLTARKDGHLVAEDVVSPAATRPSFARMGSRGLAVAFDGKSLKTGNVGAEDH